MSLTQVFYLESIDGNSSGQEQSGQWDRLKGREFACGQGKWAPKPGSSIWRVSTAGAGIVEFIDGSWLKCRPVGKGNENDFAPEAEKGSRAFRVV